MFQWSVERTGEQRPFLGDCEIHPVLIQSFAVRPRDILASVLQVTEDEGE